MESDDDLDWHIPPCREALNTINPIRRCVEVHFVDPISKCQKELFKVSIGDPTIFGNLPPHPALGEALKDAVDGNKYNGMAHSSGVVETRQSIAEELSKYPSPYPLSKDDIFVTCGSHGALDICFKVLCPPGSSVLLPRPCYTIYKCLADAFGIKLKYYKLMPNRGWEVDLEDLDKEMDDKSVSALIINNPSNPCGSVYSKDHLLDIISIAEKHRVPIIADEIYADMVFKGHMFHPVGSLSKNVPVLTCGGISKKYLVPGWRCGWLVVHDRNNLFSKMVKPGIANLMMKLVAPAALIQAAIPAMFKNVPGSFHMKTMDFFERNATLCYAELKNVPGLTPVMPAGALYMMVNIEVSSFPDFSDDVTFMKHLIIEQGVVGLPGSIFQYPDAMRLVLVMPPEKLHTACERISRFCKDHYKPTN